MSLHHKQFYYIWHTCTCITKHKHTLSTENTCFCFICEHTGLPGCRHPVAGPLDMYISDNNTQPRLGNAWPFRQNLQNLSSSNPVFDVLF